MLLCYPSEKHVMRSCSFGVLAAAAQRLEQDHDGSDEKADNEPESAKKERLMPDLCVICLEHEYNMVFVPCGHVCCCMTCSSHLTSCPLCRRRIDQVVRTFSQ